MLVAECLMEVCGRTDVGRFFPFQRHETTESSRTTYKLSFNCQDIRHIPLVLYCHIFPKAIGSGQPRLRLLFGSFRRGRAQAPFRPWCGGSSLSIVARVLEVTEILYLRSFGFNSPASEIFYLGLLQAETVENFVKRLYGAIHKFS